MGGHRSNHERGLLRVVDLGRREGVELRRLNKGIIWRNMRLIDREDYAEALKDMPAHETAKINAKGEAHACFGVNSSCTAEYYNTLHQKGVLLHPPNFDHSRKRF